MKPCIVVVSHACVIDTNQSVFAILDHDFDVTLVVPRRWRDELRHRRYQSRQLSTFHGEFVRLPTWGIGRPQRHVELVRMTKFLRDRAATFVVIEEEPFSLAGVLWAWAARRAGVPYAVQVAETLARELPTVVERASRRTLEHASFVLARSPAALDRAREWGYRGVDAVVVHAVEDVVEVRAAHPTNVVGFVGRIVAAKGVQDLIVALESHPELQLRVAGDGPERERLAQLGVRVTLLGTVPSDQMAEFYESVSVIAVPSRTTPSWSEQFGRVIVEAQSRATPVVGYSSGEIPWVASLTAALLVDEGDVLALAEALARVASDAELAQDIGLDGRSKVAAHFTVSVVAEQLRSLIEGSTTERSGSH